MFHCFIILKFFGSEPPEVQSHLGQDATSLGSIFSENQVAFTREKCSIPSRLDGIPPDPARKRDPVFAKRDPVYLGVFLMLLNHPD